MGYCLRPYFPVNFAVLQVAGATSLLLWSLMKVILLLNKPLGDPTYCGDFYPLLELIYLTDDHGKFPCPFKIYSK